MVPKDDHVPIYEGFEPVRVPVGYVEVIEAARLLVLNVIKKENIKNYGQFKDPDVRKLAEALQMLDQASGRNKWEL